MAGQPIPLRVCTFAVAGVIAAIAVPVSADVMEIDDDGSARWIAGGSPTQFPEVAIISAASDLVDVPYDLAIPAEAASETNLHTRIIPAQYAAKVAELSSRFDLSPSLIEALVWQESRWRPNAVSHAGARGLAQLMPATARELGVDPDDPMQNLEGGARYLRQQLDRFDGDLEKALAAYNAGPGRVIRANGIPRIRETQKYVAAIMGRLSDYSRPQAPVN